MLLELKPTDEKVEHMKVPDGVDVQPAFRP
jgi:hypothetical protein